MKTHTYPQVHTSETLDGFLTPKELASRHGCSVETLKRRRRAGILRAYKFGRGVRFKLSEVLAYEAQARA